MDKISIITGIRIEWKDGKGLFQSNIGYRILKRHSIGREICNAHEEFPTPYEDIQEEFTIHHRCAYFSWNFEKWYTPEEINFLLGKGFRIFILVLENPLFGTFQIGFTESNIIRKYEISRFFKTKNKN